MYTYIFFPTYFLLENIENILAVILKINNNKLNQGSILPISIYIGCMVKEFNYLKMFNWVRGNITKICLLLPVLRCLYRVWDSAHSPFSSTTRPPLYRPSLQYTFDNLLVCPITISNYSVSQK